MKYCKKCGILYVTDVCPKCGIEEPKDQPEPEVPDKKTLTRQWIGLIVGIPLFIMCGFVHSIADAFYYTLALDLGEWTGQTLVVYLASIIGNFIGCNLYRTMQLAAPKTKQ